MERPSYDRTLLSLRQRGARLHAVELQPDGIDTDALARLLEGGAAGGRGSRTSSPTSRTPRATRFPWRSAAGFSSWPPSTTSSSSRTTPTWSCASAASRCRRCSRWIPSGWSTPRRSRRPSVRAIRVGYLVGPPDLIGGIAQLATNTYISPNMVAQAIVYEFCASRAIDRSIETVRRALAERAETLANALRRELPEAQFVPPQGGYFMWVTLPPGTDVAALYHAAAERGVSFVKGTDFVLDGRREHPAPGLLGRHARTDRGRRGAACRGLPPPLGPASSPNPRRGAPAELRWRRVGGAQVVSISRDRLASGAVPSFLCGLGDCGCRCPRRALRRGLRMAGGASWRGPGWGRYFGVMPDCAWMLGELTGAFDGFAPRIMQLRLSGERLAQPSSGRSP